MLQRRVSVQKLWFGVTCDFMLELGQFFFRGDKAGEGSEAFIQNGRALVKIRNLLQGSGSQAVSSADDAFVGLEGIG
jgi:hypothetical protein